METTETPQQLVTRAATEMLERVTSNDDVHEAGFGLMGLDAAADTIRAATGRAVQEMREKGATWATIGAALGTTRSAAQQRYGK